MTVKISDHALVRWMGRAHDIDTEGYRATLEKIAAPYAALRVKHVEIGGLWFVFEGAVLVTILPTKPDSRSTCANDRGSRNGSDAAREVLHWKGQKRRRAHK